MAAVLWCIVFLVLSLCLALGVWWFVLRIPPGTCVIRTKTGKVIARLSLGGTESWQGDESLGAYDVYGTGPLSMSASGTGGSADLKLTVEKTVVLWSQTNNTILNVRIAPAT